jgi:hypothetical protein
VDRTVVYPARRIITMDSRRPTASHVAVRAGRVLAVGGLAEVASWGAHTIDDRFADKVLMPGLVEGHGHMMTGGIWRYAYVGHIDRVSPDGRRWPAVRDNASLVARLREAAAGMPADQPLLGWGLDPLFLDGPRLSRRELDQVSSERPIAILHSNGHLMTANSAALRIAGYDQDTRVTGVAMGDDGQPTGELQEMAAMMPVMRRLKFNMDAISKGSAAILAYAETARRAGVTTIADLGRALSGDDVEALLAITGRDDFPIRLTPTLIAHYKPAAELIADALAFRARSTDKLRLGAVKIIVDGSIQGFTARLKWPGYYRGADHGIWNVAPDTLNSLVEALNAAGLHIHVHVNGDEASEAALDAFERALASHPRPDHRHTLQHCQLADTAQFERMKALGLCVNLFANHLYYFGDKHYEVTVGPDRAERMNACGTAIALGVPLAIHSDTPITPLGPLFTAWCAVNRRTESGRVLGPAERISVDAALRAITLGAAYTMKMDHEIGSIAVGKWADFAVLADDPLAVAPEALKDVRVEGTVLAGRPMMDSVLEPEPAG